MTPKEYQERLDMYLKFTRLDLEFIKSGLTKQRKEINSQLDMLDIAISRTIGAKVK